MLTKETTKAELTNKFIEIGAGSLEKTVSGPTVEDKLTTIKNQTWSDLTTKFLTNIRNNVVDQIKTLDNNPRLLLQLGEIHLAKKNYSRARKIFNNIIQIKNDFYPAYERLILSNLLLNEYSEVDDIYRKYISVTNQRIEVVHNYVLFRIFYKGIKDDTNIKTCLSMLQEILDKKADYYPALNTFGFILLNTGKIDESKEYFEEVLKHNEYFLDALNNLGVYYMRKSELVTAEKYFDKVLSINKNFVAAHENKIQIILQRKEFSKAKRYVIDLEKTNIALPIKWKATIAYILLNQKQVHDAIELYQDYIKQIPDNPFILNNLGFSYFIINDYTEAYKHLQYACSILKSRGQLGKSPIALRNFGRVLLAQKNYDELKMVIDEIFYYFPNDPFGFYLAAAILISRRQFGKAKQLLYKALATQPPIDEIYCDLGFILASIERNYKEAIEIMNIAVDKGISSDLTINNLAYSLVKYGRLNEAERIFRLIKNFANPVFFATKGMIMIRKGFLKKGESLYKKAISNLSDKYNKTVARQILNVEKATYYIERNNSDRAMPYLKEAQRLGRTYVNQEITEVLRNIKKI